MAKYVLAVYDVCRDYLERFLAYTESRKHLSFRAEGFTDLSILAKQSPDKIDAVLLSPEDMISLVSLNNTDLLTAMKMNDLIVLFLGEQHSAGRLRKILEEKGCGSNVRIIEKYQSMEKILAEIDEILVEKKGSPGELPDPADLHVSGIYSPADKVSHPQAAQVLAKDQGRVLYINLEQFSGFSDPEDPGKDSGVTDVIYCYKNSPSKLGEVLKQKCGTLGTMDVLTGPDNMDDLEVLGEEEWPGFLKAASIAGNYQLILIDMSAFSWKIADVVLSYGNLYIPALPYDDSRTYRSVLTSAAAGQERRRERSSAKLRQFRRFFAAKGFESYQERILEVQLDTE
ncbi:MAG: hypothetical protein IJ106_10895 [Parasporobacterium sp.]|nr:hypothetical protein [Parasporobacterium sp.]